MTNAAMVVPNGDVKPDLLDVLAKQFPGTRGQIFEARAPGRVNLIGEHTDYNDGFVLPVAIDREVYAVGKRRPDDKIIVHSANFNSRASFELDALGLATHQSWINNIQGVADALQRAGHHVSGAEMVVWGNVPLAAGMSSSAAVEVACIMLIRMLSGIKIEPEQDALLCQQAENNFVGVQSGIMDQFISRLGVADHALMLDCRSLAYDLIPMNLPGIVLGVVHSGVPRPLADSAYNERRRQCEESVSLLQQFMPTITALRDVSADDLSRYSYILPDLLMRRARHVVREDARVGEAVIALRAGDLPELGRLFEASQVSMRDDYEITVPDVDALVAVARRHGSLASRMTGGGFGGCTVNLVPEVDWERFSDGVFHEYVAQTGRTPSIMKCTVTDGASIREV